MEANGNGGDEKGKMYDLPEGCVANVLSFTGPRDAGRFSMVSSTFKSASDSDVVWESYLPDDYRAILSSSSESCLLNSSSYSKKQLYLRLCDNPILIDNGKKSFSLEKWSGKKCYMLSARDLMIVWGDTPRHWQWTSELKSRFAEVAELVGVCWLEICGKMNTRMLTPETLYAAYFVYQTTAGVYGFNYQPVEVTVGLAGTEGCKRSVYLDAEEERRQRHRIIIRRVGLFSRSRALGLQPPVPAGENDDGMHPQEGEDMWSEDDDDIQPQEIEDGRLDGNVGTRPREREDGWLEIELGEFFNKDGDDGELEMKILEVNGGDWKGGLIVQGIEIRPKRG